MRHGLSKDFIARDHHTKVDDPERQQKTFLPSRAQYIHAAENTHGHTCHVFRSVSIIKSLLRMHVEKTARKRKAQTAWKYIGWPEVVAAQHHTHNVLPNVMDISLYCGQEDGALIGILLTTQHDKKKKIRIQMSSMQKGASTKLVGLSNENVRRWLIT